MKNIIENILQLPLNITKAFLSVMKRGVEREVDAMTGSAGMFSQKQGLIDL